MLNLFKLPFLSSLRSSEDDRQAAEFETGLVASYLKHKKNLSEEELDQACDVASREMAALRKKMRESDDGDGYDLMMETLRRIDRDMGK